MAFPSHGVIGDRIIIMFGFGLTGGVATVDWILLFPTIKAHHLDCFHSDHKPVFLGMDSDLNCFYRKGRPF